MGPNSGAVRHADQRWLITLRQDGEQFLPYAALAPAIEPVEHRRPRTIDIRQGPPAQTFPEPVQNAADDAAIVDPRLAAKRRQQCSIAAHCTSLSQNVSAILQALLPSLNQTSPRRRNGYTA